LKRGKETGGNTGERGDPKTNTSGRSCICWPNEFGPRVNADLIKYKTSKRGCGVNVSVYSNYPWEE